MVNEIKSAVEATKIATTFLKQYYNYVHPISAVKENGNWLVKVDVGILLNQIAEVKIDASTADVIGYSVPKK